MFRFVSFKLTRSVFVVLLGWTDARAREGAAWLDEERFAYEYWRRPRMFCCRCMFYSMWTHMNTVRMPSFSSQELREYIQERIDNESIEGAYRRHRFGAVLNTLECSYGSTNAPEQPY